MTDIKHKLTIKATPDIVYNAITTQQGLESWWAKQTVAKPEVGFVNIFTFGTAKNEIKVTALERDKKAVWNVIHSAEEWNGTSIWFGLEGKDGKTILRFAHDGWRAETDFYAECNFAWGQFMMSLKSYCETGKGNPS
jgi:uncharacterized protein YndB with AHSA1/START domain